MYYEAKMQLMNHPDYNYDEGRLNIFLYAGGNPNFSDPDYNVDTMANDVGISRAQLHRKMKEITGVSTGKFLRNLRMEQAARLLREGKINVSQIADHVGYADQAHFSTAFKTHFGQSPSEYAETHKE
jgi:AraC-like DNA-binding protein